MTPAGLLLLLMAVGLSLGTFASEPERPHETGSFRRSDLVELKRLIPDLRLDIRYATSHNFIGRPVYTQARAFLQRPAALALARVDRALRRRGYGLVVLDAYRPWSVTRLFWQLTPLDKRQYVADPRRGSRHNRGCAVDVTLFRLKTGREVAMPSGFDAYNERAHADYAGGSPRSRRLRDLLRRAMVAEGFHPLAEEWWHFDYKDWRAYPILDIPFHRLR